MLLLLHKRAHNAGITTSLLTIDKEADAVLPFLQECGHDAGITTSLLTIDKEADAVLSFLQERGHDAGISTGQFRGGPQYLQGAVASVRVVGGHEGCVYSPLE